MPSPCGARGAVSPSTNIIACTLKLPFYARAELREVWLVALKAEAIEVYTRPAPRGYRAHATVGRGRVLSPLAFPRVRFRTNEILG